MTINDNSDNNNHEDRLAAGAEQDAALRGADRGPRIISLQIIIMIIIIRIY